MSKLLVDRDRMVESMCLTWRHDFGLDKLEGCDFCSGMTDKEREHLRGQMGKLFDHHFAPALSAVTAERDMVAGELSEIRVDVSYYAARNEQLRAEVEALRADAERFRWLAHQGDACQWMNIIRVDPDDFESYAEAVDAAMAAKEA